MNANTYLIVNQYRKSRTSDRRPYVTLACERGGSVRKKTKPIVDDEEEVPIKMRGPYSKWLQVRIDNCSYTTGGTTINYHVRPPYILRFFCEQGVGCAVRFFINSVAKIKKNMMQNGVTRPSIETVRKSNVLSDIVVAHPTSIVMIRMYNMPLLEALGMTSTGKNFTVATACMCNEQATTYRWHKLINEIDEAEYRKKLEVLKTRWKSRPDLLHFGIETTNHAESEHSVLKLWLSTRHGDLDTIYLNIDSVIKKKYDAKSDPILKNLSNRISHLALKKIWFEIKRAGEIRDDLQSKCGHYLRKSHGLPCACKLCHWYQYLLLLEPKDVYIYWRKLEIGVDILSVYERDLDSEMRDLTWLLEKVRRLVKGVISPVLSDDPWSTIILPLYSNMNCTAGMLCIGLISDQQHFMQLQMRDGCPLPPMQVQWQYHRDVSVSGWANLYYAQFVEWVRISRTEYPTRGATHVIIP
ncbi:hypothetical protein M9H77_09500 [Catharanthus roseus]|uniref:Uncharacterized protein n=1 Tax=Catharanthus roseus TaxID=4058 RepID=A0ACC0C0Y5_CATRO|nr:hypothetical protein M9H77_09500 [Catharanthus roseus]